MQFSTRHFEELFSSIRRRVIFTECGKVLRQHFEEIITGFENPSCINDFLELQIRPVLTLDSEAVRRYKEEEEMNIRINHAVSQLKASNMLPLNFPSDPDLWDNNNRILIDREANNMKHKLTDETHVATNAGAYYTHAAHRFAEVVSISI
jgi:hypothetical protein